MPKHFLHTSNFKKDDYEELFRRSVKLIKDGIPPDLCKSKVAASLFFLPSTRTMISTQTAMIHAGGGWVGVQGEQGLSMEKGESFEDTVRAFGEVSDVIVLRHPDDDAAERAAKHSMNCPVINGGCGSTEHAMAGTMLMALFNEYLGRLEGLKIGIYGTPGINRCVKAMLPVMGYYNLEVVADNFGILPVPENVITRAKENGLKSFEYDSLENFIGDIDLLICTRGLQKGILSRDQFSEEQEKEVIEKYKPITTEHMKKLRNDAQVMMLFPRIFEIDREVDSDPRAMYMKKMYFEETLLAIMTYVMGIDV
jgi:aspartate carbamoyltransferase catalytic subunit